MEYQASGNGKFPLEQKAVETMTTNKMNEMTPAEVDNILVDAMGTIGENEAVIDQQEHRIEIYEERVENYTPMLEYPTLSVADRTYWEGQLAKTAVLIAQAKEDIAARNETLIAARKVEAVCTTEFYRRGGWTRFWIVVNSNGHIHSSRSCTTCFPTTQFAWLPELSGSNDAEVVELAGESACTICFPNAPVDSRNRPSKIEEPARKAAREERERKAAEKLAKTTAKAIANPDGTEIRLTGSWGNRIKTEAEAQRIFVNNMESFITDEDGRYIIPNREYVAEMKADNAILLTALAAKRGTTEAEQLALLTKKAVANVKKNWK